MGIFETIAKALIFNNSKIENINKQVDKNSKSIKDLKKSVSTSDMPTIELDLKILNLSDLTEFDSNVDVTAEVIREFLGFASEGDFSQNLLKLHNRKFTIKLMNRWNFNNNYFEVYSSSICSGRVLAYGSTNIFIIVIPFYDSNGAQYELYFQANDYSQTGFFSIISRTETYSKFANKADITDLVNRQLVIATSSSMTLSPNTYYRNTSTSLSSLTIKLGSVSDSNILNEYFVEFTTRSTGTTVSLPSGIKWANGETPTFEAGTTYQISIVNNLGVVTKFK
jgi:hypothetical protein